MDSEEKEIMTGWDLLKKIYNEEITDKDKVYLINKLDERIFLFWQYGLLYMQDCSGKREIEMFDLVNYKFEVIKSNKVKNDLLLATEFEKLIEAVNKFAKVAKESGFYK